MKLVWGARTDVGRRRAGNEDAYLADPPVFVVADGMGGHDSGEVASALAVQHLGSLGGRESVEAADVLQALRAANDAIARRGGTTLARRGMGTTVSGLAAVRNGEQEDLLVFNVGDSRLYLVRDGVLQRVTVDHSLVQEMIDSGRLDPAEASRHPQRHVVTRALGTRPCPDIDSWFLVPEDGDRYVLCTDGLTGEVAEEVLGRVARSSRDVQDIAAELVSRALTAGGRDNVTVVVVEVQDAGTPGAGE